MGRGAWLAVGGLGLVGTVGLGLWAWFLAGRSLDVMDQWSSVVSSFGTLASLVVAIVALVLAIRGPGGDGGGGSRSIHIHGDANHARISQGDASPIRGVNSRRRDR